MKYAAIQAALAAGQSIEWYEPECGSDRQARFEVVESKWSHIVGRAVVKVRLPRARQPEHDAMMPAGYIGSATYAVEDGEQGYRQARVSAMTDAYRTRTAIEGGN